MLTITQKRYSHEYVLLDRKDFDQLVERANHVEQIYVQEAADDFLLSEMQDLLTELWDNPVEEEAWMKYL
ncbi:MAG: hypothetical protein QME52_09375 [Bacteroidota bacterium]|nr:hypothetical protein [Bacteroidota bacterium]